jgi:hypothetical protein
MAELFMRDLANVEAGVYPLPADHDGPWLRYFTGRGFSSRTFPPFTNGGNTAPIRRS